MYFKTKEDKNMSAYIPHKSCQVRLYSSSFISLIPKIGFSVATLIFLYPNLFKAQLAHRTILFILSSAEIYKK